MPLANVPPDSPLARTPLYGLHVELGAKMVPFAGYEMPVRYADGILKEHLHTRAAAGLFDVSHMGQARITGADRAAALEALVPGDIATLGSMRMRYTCLTSDDGGILDDLMVSNLGETLFVVLNAACKAADVAHMRARLAGDVALHPLEDRALLALQGPKAVDVLARLNGDAGSLRFLSVAEMKLDGADCLVSRSGYTGEDGFEISAPAEAAEALARTLLRAEEVMPVGLGARDTLRLEAGLCLYGHDIDATTSPVEADLAWTISKRRRAEGGFPGAERVLAELRDGPKRRRVGIRPEGRAPAREGSAIEDPQGASIGTVTSGGFGPSVGGPIAMGYVEAEHAAPGTPVRLMVRGKALAAEVRALPFVEHRYFRG